MDERVHLDVVELLDSPTTPDRLLADLAGCWPTMPRRLRRITVEAAATIDATFDGNDPRVWFAACPAAQLHYATASSALVVLTAVAHHASGSSPGRHRDQVIAALAGRPGVPRQALSGIASLPIPWPSARPLWTDRLTGRDVALRCLARDLDIDDAEVIRWLPEVVDRDVSPSTSRWESMLTLVQRRPAAIAALVDLDIGWVDEAVAVPLRPLCEQPTVRRLLVERSAAQPGRAAIALARHPALTGQEANQLAAALAGDDTPDALHACKALSTRRSPAVAVSPDPADWPDATVATVLADLADLAEPDASTLLDLLWVAGRVEMSGRTFQPRNAAFAASRRLARSRVPADVTVGEIAAAYRSLAGSDMPGLSAAVAVAPDRFVDARPVVTGIVGADPAGWKALNRLLLAGASLHDAVTALPAIL